MNTAPLASAPVDRLPDVLAGSRAPIWWAMLLVVAIETTVFFTFISGYFYLAVVSPPWPPPGVEPPDLLLPVINTGVLITSTLVLLWGTRGLRAGNLKRFKIGVGVAALLEGVFFTIKMVVTTGLKFGWSSHAYGSAFATLDRLHSLHVVIAILMAVVVEALAFQGYFTSERRAGAEVVSIYWQFVALIWLPVFFVLFISPRIF